MPKKYNQYLFFNYLVINDYNKQNARQDKVSKVTKSDHYNTYIAMMVDRKLDDNSAEFIKSRVEKVLKEMDVNRKFFIVQGKKYSFCCIETQVNNEKQMVSSLDKLVIDKVGKEVMAHDELVGDIDNYLAYTLNTGQSKMNEKGQVQLIPAHEKFFKSLVRELRQEESEDIEIVKLNKLYTNDKVQNKTLKYEVTDCLNAINEYENDVQLKIKDAIIKYQNVRDFVKILNRDDIILRSENLGDFKNRIALIEKQSKEKVKDYKNAVTELKNLLSFEDKIRKEYDELSNHYTKYVKPFFDEQERLYNDLVSSGIQTYYDYETHTFCKDDMWNVFYSKISENDNKVDLVFKIKKEMWENKLKNYEQGLLTIKNCKEDITKTKDKLEFDYILYKTKMKEFFENCKLFISLGEKGQSK